MGRSGFAGLASLVVVALAALGVVAPGAPGRAVAADPFAAPLKIPPVLTGDDITVRMEQADVQVLPPPAPKTRMWTYGGTFPGPTIRRPSGRRTRVTFVNALPRAAGSMTVHHHGSHSAPSEDGHPSEQLIPPGGRRTYTYDLMEGGEPERAAFQWYHDHRMDVTGRNVWMGLAGMFILDDEVDSALPLPKGEFDVPLMLTDRNFDDRGQLEYEFNGAGTLGDVLLVNGRPTPHLDVAARRYRFRILNASNRREYALELSDGRPLVQIATESGLLPEPVRRRRILVGPAERVEVVVDFTGMLGRDLVLRNTAERVIGGPAEDVNPPAIMQFRVRRSAPDDSRVPAKLRPLPRFADPVVTRRWVLGSVPVAGKITRPDNTDDPAWAIWTINGLPFDHHRVDAEPKLGSTERWIFQNVSGLHHRIHIHDVDWKVVRRRGGVVVFDPNDPTAAEGETGLRETFMVGLGEEVEVLSTRFDDHVGTYIFHCHILEHEDSGMMTQFRVVP